MMFFTILGWLMLVIFSLGLTIGAPWVILLMSAFGGNRAERWFALVPFTLGCLALYGLFTHSPLHISLA